jgi:hypothetical protein
MKKFVSKKSAVLGLVVAVVVAATAIAYWSASGSGTGTGTTDNPAAAGALSVSNPVGVGDVTFPGDSGAITGTITNNNDYAVNVTSLTSAISTGSAESACDGDDNFSVDNLRLVDGQGATLTAKQLAEGQSVAYAGTFSFDETDALQDGCKGVTTSVKVSAE